MERTMSTMSLDVMSVHPRRVWRLAAMIGAAAATAVVIGLLTAGTFSAATGPKAGVSASLNQPVAALERVTFKIEPSPVVETNGQFFFGTGDGSAGYYSERPAQ